MERFRVMPGDGQQAQGGIPRLARAVFPQNAVTASTLRSVANPVCVPPSPRRMARISLS